MNIKVQICGIALIVLIAVLYARQRKLNLVTSKLFTACLYASLACLVLDIFSLVAIYYQQDFGEFLTKFICRTYLASLLLVGLLANLYVSTAVSLHLQYYKKVITVSVAFTVIMMALAYALPIAVGESLDKSLAWTEGPAIYSTYGGMLVLIVSNIVHIFMQKQYIFERQRMMVLIWMMLWIVSATVQIFVPDLLIVGFAGALGVALVYFQFENPELNLDRGTGLLNYVAFTRYGEQLYSGHKSFSVIGILLEDSVWQDSENKDVIAGALRNYRKNLKDTGALVFRIMENQLLLVFSNEEQAGAAWNKFIKRFRTGEAENAKAYNSFYLVEDPRCVSSYSELLDLLQYYSYRKKDAKLGGFYIINSGTVEQMQAERKMAQQVVDALEDDRVVVYYQPIYSVDEGRFVTAEALVRIIDKDGKLIPPGAFIPIIENNGMITDIGKHVFEKVCKFFKQSSLEKYGIKYIEVNLSVAQCEDGALADDYIAIMDATGMNPEHINLEITESASLRDKEGMLKNMDRLIEYGVQFSLDDFGTGESNLNYIVDMPVKIVKFDRSMIQSYFESGKAKYVMDAAMHMIRGMGLEMVAEGIETEEQYKKMEDMRINFIQGFYFSKPLPENDFVSFLTAANAKFIDGQ